MPHRSRLSALAALLLLAAGCSLSDDEQTAADSLQQALVTRDSPRSVEDTADCVAQKWVGEVGTHALVADGVLTSRFAARVPVVHEMLAGRQPVSRDVAEAYAAAWLACADFDAMSLDLEDSHPDASGEELDEYADCLKAIDDELWQRALVLQLTGDDTSSAPAALRREKTACRRELDQRAR